MPRWFDWACCLYDFGGVLWCFTLLGFVPNLAVVCGVLRYLESRRNPSNAFFSVMLNHLQKAKTATHLKMIGRTYFCCLRQRLTDSALVDKGFGYFPNKKADSIL